MNPDLWNFKRQQPTWQAETHALDFLFERPETTSWPLVSRGGQGRESRSSTAHMVVENCVVDEVTRRAVHRSVTWLDGHNGRTEHQITLRILKISEEAGEAAAAWIGVLGNNPRKGTTHCREQVAAELADVAITALVAIESLGLDAGRVLADCAAKVLDRFGDPAGQAGA
jgi:NTP pyrophosphatase (non-canonical NTP hydrolase)